MAVLRGSGRADFTFEVKDLDPDLFRVLGFHGSEGLSTPYRFELELVSLDEQVDFASVVGAKGALVIQVPDGERFIHGFVSRFEQSGRGRKLTHYTARLVPRLWMLSLRRQSRIFQDLTTPEILQEVLQKNGFGGGDVSLVTQRKYKPRKYCVQYRETDLDFLSRLMEEEGIFYFFRNTEKDHVLVIGDDASAHGPLVGKAEVPFREGESGTLGPEQVKSWRMSQGMRVGTVTLREFDFKKPSLDLTSKQEADEESQHEFYDYPGEYPDSGLGGELARIRLEEQRARKVVGAAESDCRRLVSGYRFTLEGHPRADFDQEYLLVGIEHWGEQPQAAEEDLVGTTPEPMTYGNRLECIPSAVPFRPPRLTHCPRVEGPQTAVVVGSTGEEIHTDELGRVQVRFHWERNNKDSCWIRVSQPSAGGGWGGMFLPRVGQEVVVEFLEGDPDRPLITGCVYNGTNPPPYPLPDEKTISTIRSSSSPGGGGANELRFEDKKDNEQIMIQAQKDFDLFVKNDRRESIGRDRHLAVKRDKIGQIERDLHQQVGRDEIQEVTRDRSRKVAGKEMIEIEGTRSLTVKGGAHDSYQASHSMEVASGLGIKATSITLEGASDVTLKVGGSVVRIDPSGVAVVGGTIKLNSGGGGSPAKMCGSVPALKIKSPAQAASADAGAVQQGQADDRKSHKEPGDPKKTSWIELQLVDDAGQPVAGEAYEVEMADGTVATGTTGADGVARVSGIDPGTCKIRFPNLDKDAWEPK